MPHRYASFFYICACIADALRAQNYNFIMLTKGKAYGRVANRSRFTIPRVVQGEGKRKNVLCT